MMAETMSKRCSYKDSVGRPRRPILQRGLSLLLVTTLVPSLFPMTAFAWNNNRTESAVNRNASLSMKASKSSPTDNDKDGSCTRQRVVVIGANGQTGFRVIRLLHERSDKYQPIAMIREASQAEKFDNIQVPWFVGDLDASAAPTAADLEGTHTVIFAAGAGRSRPNLKKVSIDYLAAVRSMASAQETTTVKRFILLSGINSDPLGTRRSVDSTDLAGPLSAWHRLKAHSETYLKEMHLHGRPLDWTILCPGRLVDDDNETPGKVKLSLIHGEDDLKASLTNAEKLAAIKRLPGSHDGMTERLCVSRDNTALTLVGLLDAPNVSSKSITVVNGILSVEESIAAL